jgi:hypothetical protein
LVYLAINNIDSIYSRLHKKNTKQWIK